MHSSLCYKELRESALLQAVIMSVKIDLSLLYERYPDIKLFCYHLASVLLGGN